MNILLTGATGFIGSGIFQKLRRQPRFGLRVATRTPHCLHPDGIVIGSIHRQTDWSHALQGIDVVIHLAAYAHVIRLSQLDQTALNETNIAGTENLVCQAITAGVKHFIFVSSIGAVTSFSEVPLKEEDHCRPDTPYGRSKLAAEKALIELASHSSMAWTILRPTLVYGAGNPGNMERLMKLVKTGVPLPLGSIHNQRSFVYVENLVDAIATCIHHPKARGQIFHVSDGEDLSTPELIRSIAHFTDCDCRLLPVPPWLLRKAGRVGDQLESLTSHQLPLNSSTVEKLLGSLVVDNSKICNILDWSPPFSVEAGLSKTFQQS